MLPHRKMLQMMNCAVRVVGPCACVVNQVLCARVLMNVQQQRIDGNSRDIETAASLAFQAHRPCFRQREVPLREVRLLVLQPETSKTRTGPWV